MHFDEVIHPAEADLGRMPWSIRKTAVPAQLAGGKALMASNAVSPELDRKQGFQKCRYRRLSQVFDRTLAYGRPELPSRHPRPHQCSPGARVSRLHGRSLLESMDQSVSVRRAVRVGLKGGRAGSTRFGSDPWVVSRARGNVKTMMYVIWALFVLGVAWSIFRMDLKAKRHRRRIAHWPRLQPTVTGSRTGWTSGTGNSTQSIRHFPIYQFVAPTGAVFVGESEVSLRNRPTPGLALEVAYDPADPHTSFQVSSQDRLAVGCLTAFFAGFALLSFWLIGVFPLL